MRCIKFRAYCKKDKEMFFSEMYQAKTNMSFGLSSFLSEVTDIEETLMQYTGLNDKNIESVSEVYTNDILLFKDSKIGVVEWDYENTGYCVIMQDNNEKIPLVKALLDCAIVIGNIHENKELIGDK